MPTAAAPKLKPGRVYRTRDLARWGANPSRLAQRLEHEGRLKRLGQGLFLHPRRGRYGDVPPDDRELMRAFLAGGPFIFTGPERWNALGLGTTAIFPTRLVYNTKRSGEFEFSGRRFRLRRMRFPRQPTAEWYVIDLIENHGMAGVALEDLSTALTRALEDGRFDGDTLAALARKYATKRTQGIVGEAVERWDKAR